MGIPIEQRVTAITLSLILLLVTIQLIRKHKLREEYALVWLVATFSIVILSIFEGLVDSLAAFFAISYTPTLILVMGLLFALAILLSQSVVLSTQARCIRDLAQNIALLEWHLRQLGHDPNTPLKPLNKSGEVAPFLSREVETAASAATSPGGTINE